MSPLIPTLFAAVSALAPGCVRTRTVSVPSPIRVTTPPCVTAPPPIPAATMSSSEEADYEVALTRWAWSTWAACGPREAAP